MAITTFDWYPALADRRLLDHPFYRRWERGEVSSNELAAYASQYRHFEGYLPGFLTKLVADLPDGLAKDLIAANLADENGDPVAHVELFERFAAAVGAKADVATPATVALLATYEDLLDQGPIPAVAGFVAYECQASDIARSKADGLRRHHGLDDHAVSFWDHHARVDAQHSAWAIGALEELAAGSGQVTRAVRRGANSWWAFLDEREAVAIGPLPPL